MAVNDDHQIPPLSGNADNKLYSYAPPPLATAPLDEAMPSELKSHIEWLEKWAKSNQKDARNDTLAFWILKIPAAMFSASAGVLAHFELTTISVILGAIASFCIVIDGIHPRGLLRNTHLRAFHDLRDITGEMVTKWRSRNPESDRQKVASEIIRDSEAHRKRIAAYIRDAETALQVKQQA